MKINFTAITAAILFSFCLSAAAFGQQARLEGHIYEIANGGEIPVAGVRVIAPGGQSKETDSKGHFVIDFPNSVQAGQAARIEVNRPGWLVRTPLFGECTTKDPARNTELLRVIIVPKGSPLSLEPKQLSKVIARWADERAKLLGRVNEFGQRLDEYAFLREYAEKYGITLEQFSAAADKWAKTKELDDTEEKALKEYWLKNYDRAASLAHQAALSADSEHERNLQRTLESGRKIIRRFQLVGNARYAEYKFREALTAYNKIEAYFASRELAKDDFPEEWAETKGLIGNAKSELGTRIEGQESRVFLSEAVTAHREALTVYTRERFPQQWAAAHNNLGNALRSQGERVAGAEGIRLLTEAAVAYTEALKVRTPERSPQQWAETQNNLGIELRLQGERAADGDGARLLGKAVTAFREVLRVYTREESPQQWAGTQDNLGLALARQGERDAGEEGTRLLGESITALREALKIRTREEAPQQWAETQNNLGLALQSQGERAEGKEGTRLFGEAIDAFREALKVRTRETLPQRWAETQNNLGLALASRGERAKGEEGTRFLGQAITAFYEALKVQTRELFPQQWAMTQNNLGKAHFLLKNWKEAATCFENVLSSDLHFQGTYHSLISIYRERLFEYTKAFELYQRWNSRFPEDKSILQGFAEAHFTTGRFDECEKRITELLVNSEIQASTRTALRAIEIADLLALGQAKQIPAKLEALHTEVSQQPTTFNVNWSFNGTRHFIGQNEKLSAYRDWLRDLFDALVGKDRETILQSLREAQKDFR